MLAACAPVAELPTFLVFASVKLGLIWRWLVLLEAVLGRDRVVYVPFELSCEERLVILCF